jgi:DNA-binding response OmpR family regulator
MSNQPTVYVVDDDPAMIALLRVVAQSLDLQLHAFESAEEVLATALPAGPGCLVLDVDLPGMSGLELLAELLRRGMRLPSIVVSGLQDETLEETSRTAGAAAFVRKPFRLHELCDALHTGLRDSEKQAGTVERATETVLLVDDSPSITQFLSSYLETRGYAVLTAANGTQALQLVPRQRPDVILLDVMMPGLDGLTVCRRLKADAELRSIPVILVTAQADEEDVVRGLDAGADDYVTKPVNLKVLGARLRSALRAKKSQDTIAEINRVLQEELAHRKRVELELMQAHKLEALGRLAAGVAHEINTPAQYVGDNIRFLEQAFATVDRLLAAATPPPGVSAVEQPPAPGLEVDYLRTEIPVALRQSLEGVEQIASIVGAMREFSHPGVEDKQQIDLNRAIESTLTVTRNQWKSVAEVATELDPELPPVPCLAGAFKQALLNLVLNAAEAIAAAIGNDCEKKGQITVRTRRDGAWAEIQIADTGNGIPNAIQAKIFDPFFTTKEVGKGTGQGLAIAHATIVEKHGGTLSFQTVLGQGTTFLVRLPLTVQPAPQPA